MYTKDSFPQTTQTLLFESPVVIFDSWVDFSWFPYLVSDNGAIFIPSKKAYYQSDVFPVLLENYSLLICLNIFDNTLFKTKPSKV